MFEKTGNSKISKNWKLEKIHDFISKKSFLKTAFWKKKSKFNFPLETSYFFFRFFIQKTKKIIKMSKTLLIKNLKSIFFRKKNYISEKNRENSMFLLKKTRKNSNPSNFAVRQSDHVHPAPPTSKTPRRAPHLNISLPNKHRHWAFSGLRRASSIPPSRWSCAPTLWAHRLYLWA